MGIDKKRGSAGAPAATGKNGGSPVSGSPSAEASLLSALLASEDLLFCDPFADFTPSSR